MRIRQVKVTSDGVIGIYSDIRLGNLECGVPMIDAVEGRDWLNV